MGTAFRFTEHAPAGRPLGDEDFSARLATGFDQRLKLGEARCLWLEEQVLCPPIEGTRPPELPSGLKDTIWRQVDGWEMA